MLVLGRKTGEVVELRLGDVIIRVTVVEVRGPGRLRLGFEAPPEVKISRPDEVQRRPLLARESRLCPP